MVVEVVLVFTVLYLLILLFWTVWLCLATSFSRLTCQKAVGPYLAVPSVTASGRVSSCGV